MSTRSIRHPSTVGLIFCGLLLYVAFASSAQCDDSNKADDAAGMESAWQQASRFLFSEAHADFEGLRPEGDADERMRQLGLAVTRLGLQPRTQRNIQQAEASLHSLISENATDKAGQFARFFLARLLENHADVPDPEAAREMYYQLVLERPGHPMLELAATRVAYHDLFSAGNDPEQLAVAEANLRPLADLLETPAGRREFHTAIGRSLNDLGGDRAVALGHMRIAAGIPNPMAQMQSMNILVAAELAKDLGEYDVAREYYTKFVNEFQRDNRNYSVRKILETLPEPVSREEAHGTDS